MSGRNDAVIVREMGYTVNEFTRTLTPAMRDWRVSAMSGAWRVATVEGAPVAEITVEPRAERQIGALRLPVLAVTIDLSNASEVLAAEFRRRFERGFHRGGG